MAATRRATIRTSAELRGRAALARFAELLRGHLACGTRPRTDVGDPWSFAEFAGEVALAGSKSCSPRAVSSWCKGIFLPREIEPILRATFGLESSNRHPEPRAELRKAFQAAWAERHGAVIAGAPPAPAATPWTVADDNNRFVHDPAAQPSDEAAAALPLQQQLQQAIRRMAAELAELTAARRDRFGNYSTWKRLPDVASAFHELIARGSSEIPAHLGDAYGLMLELGGFLEADIRLQKDSMASDPPLDTDIQRPLSTMVQTAAPWLRGYPTVARLDDEAGRLLARPQQFQDAREFARTAQARRVIAADDADRIDALAEAAQRFQNDLARKSGNHAVADAYNLLLAIAGLAAAALAGVLPAPRADLARRAGGTLADARQDIAALAEAAQPDL